MDASKRRALTRLLAAGSVPALSALATGCALSPFADPPRVQLAGIEGLPGEGLELRFALRLRVQNPNPEELAWDGISLELDLRGQSFASGVAPLAGRVPGYGEAVVTVPVSVSGFAIARQVLDLARGRGPKDRVPYALRGRLGGVMGGVRFASSGEVDLGG